jgi:hypothetical protein
MFGDSIWEIQLPWTPKLYKWFEDIAKIQLSTRRLILGAIAADSLHPDIADVFLESLSGIHEKESQIHESNPQKYGSTVGKRTSLWELKSILQKEEWEKNRHHIVPTDKGEWFKVFNGKVAYTKSMKNRIRDFSSVFGEYKLYTTNVKGHYFTWVVKGSHDEKNIYGLTIDRHNYWLNQRYWGNAFVQLQFLLERYGENKSYRDILFLECREMDEIEKILRLQLSEFHHPDCLETRTTKA